ncbi:MAG: membrane dipeptidase [Armatimonadetes bacterium]|nr:membrane dipeptidase [Armatimonadota bacterium]
MATAKPARAASGVDPREFHRTTIVIDALGGGLMAPGPGGSKPPFWQWKEGGLTALNVTVVARFARFLEALRAIYASHTILEAYPEDLLLARRGSDLARAHREGRTGVILGFQGAAAMEDDLTNLTIFHRLGIRIIALTYMERNLLGDGCLEPENRGLTHLGRQAVCEMNRLGIVVDLSHVGERTSLDACEISGAPVALTHSNPRRLCDSPRNVSDELIRAVARTGGVIGITPYAPTLSPTPKAGTRSTMEDLLRHIAYVVDMVGIEHVGIGTDMFEAKGATEWNSTTKRRYPESVGAYEHANLRTTGFESLSQWPAVTERLLAAGYSTEDVAKIVGGNWARVFARVWDSGPDL